MKNKVWAFIYAVLITVMLVLVAGLAAIINHKVKTNKVSDPGVYENKAEVETTTDEEWVITQPGIDSDTVSGAGVALAMDHDAIMKAEEEQETIEEVDEGMIKEEEIRKEYDENGVYIPKGYVKHDVPELLQNPELPTGCELVSLVALLQFHGFTDLDKTDFVDKYLFYSETGNIRDGFLGNPYNTKGAGCFSNVTRQVADNFLYNNESSLGAFDLMGATFEEICNELDYGMPLLAWTTIDMKKPTIDLSNEKVGDYTFYKYEHCVVLMGYNLEDGVFYVMDPLVGYVERDIEEFMDIYNKIGKYCMVIWPGYPAPSSETGFGKMPK